MLNIGSAVRFFFSNYFFCVFFFSRNNNKNETLQDDGFYKKQTFPFKAYVVSSRMHEEQRLPYRGSIQFRESNRVPIRGKIQIVIVSPHNTPVFWYAVQYDMTEKCPKRSKCCVRQQVKCRGSERAGLFLTFARPVSQRLYLNGKIRFFFPCSDPCLDEGSCSNQFTRHTKFSEHVRLSTLELTMFSKAFDKERRQFKRRRLLLSDGLPSPPEQDEESNRKRFDFSRTNTSPTSIVETPTSCLFRDLTI